MVKKKFPKGILVLLLLFGLMYFSDSSKKEFEHTYTTLEKCEANRADEIADGDDCVSDCIIVTQEIVDCVNNFFGEGYYDAELGEYGLIYSTVDTCEELDDYANWPKPPSNNAKFWKCYFSGGSSTACPIGEIKCDDGVCRSDCSTTPPPDCSTTPPPSSEGFCLGFANDLLGSFVSDDCEMATIIFAVGAFLLLMIIMVMVKK